jgi:hypothetical protein
MRVLNLTLSLLSVVALSFVVSGCGQDFVGKISCTDAKTCMSKAKGLFDVDAGDPSLFPQCCGGYCMMPAGGCDSGYRYLDNDPGYGACTEMNFCPPSPDLSMPEQPGDMAMSQSD